MLDPITRLNAALEGRYRIERQLGEGGMAVVYVADDLRHERRVALKVLKAELAAVVGADRFLAEIKTTANLQHPNILPLFDSGEADGFLFYVMPYVEGESLRQRIDREKQLPVTDAVAIASAVASALQHAHERGVVHRDIKPANILLQDGQPVIADFGIALAVGSAGGNRLTETGLSVGTPYYMSPEQATGDQHVGPASDIYALACVLHEMLTGDPPYLGSTAQAVLGQIIAGDPVSVTKKRRSVPANVDAAIRRALEKLPADRFTGAQDFTRALADPGFKYAQGVGVSGSGGRPWNALTVALALTTLVFGGLAGTMLLRPPSPRPVERFPSPFLAGQEPVPTVGGWGLSADGSTMVYARPGALWVRRLRDLAATPIPGTNPTGSVTLSPDGDRVVYSERGDLKILPLSLGSPRTLLTSAGEAFWGSDDYIYVSVPGGTGRVRPAGGPPERLTQRSDGDRQHVVTDVLPGGSAALLLVHRLNLPSEIHALDLTTLERTILARGTDARYAHSGHIVFTDWDTGDYVAAPFDADALEITGPIVTVIEGQLWGPELSASGTLVYAYRPEETEFAWVTRSGQTEAIGWTFAGQVSRGFSLSGDDRLLAFASSGLNPGSGNIWRKELPDGPTVIVADEEATAWDPRWRRDGETLIYTLGTPLTSSVVSRSADGTGAAAVLFQTDSLNIPSALLSPDEEWLLLRVGGPRPTIMAMRPGVDSGPEPLFSDAYTGTQPDLSPDGGWLAYASDESGQLEVYVRPFPGTEAGRILVSTGGGRQPRWAHNGAELFYVSGEVEMWSAQYETEPGFRVTARERLFEIPEEFTGFAPQPLYTAYEVSSDDQRFLMTRPSAAEDAGTPSGVVIVQNFDEELKELVPVR